MICLYRPRGRCIYHIASSTEIPDPIDLTHICTCLPYTSMIDQQFALCIVTVRVRTLEPPFSCSDVDSV